MKLSCRHSKAVVTKQFVTYRSLDCIAFFSADKLYAVTDRGDENEDEKVGWRVQFDDCFYESNLILCEKRSEANKIEKKTIIHIFVRK